MLTFIGQTRKTRRSIEPLNSRKHDERKAPLGLKNSRAARKEASGTPLSQQQLMPESTGDGGLFPYVLFSANSKIVTSAEVIRSSGDAASTLLMLAHRIR